MTLLIIDLIDERTRNGRDHLHAWGARSHLEDLKERLEDYFGNDRQHQIVDSDSCPDCGVVK